MNTRYLIFCDKLTKVDVQDTDIMDIYDNNLTTQLNEVCIVNNKNFKLFNIHFPFEIVERMLVEYTNAVPSNHHLIVEPLRIKIYINSPYSHDVILHENGAFLKEHYKLFMSLYYNRHTTLNGPMTFENYAVWEVKNDLAHIQIVSVYKYDKTILQVDI